MKRHTIAIFLENESGSLSSIVGLFSQRNYNIESLTVAPTHDATLSRVTLTTIGNEETLEQLNKQLNKLVCVFKVIELSEQSHIEREVAFIKVRSINSQRAEVKRISDIFGATIVDVTATSFIIQMVGKSKAINALLNALDAKQVLEVARSGVCGIVRGEKAVNT